ncbi:hypothetical protein D3C75_658750 [compost metagenome]
MCLTLLLFFRTTLALFFVFALLFCEFSTLFVTTIDYFLSTGDVDRSRLFHHRTNFVVAAGHTTTATTMPTIRLRCAFLELHLRTRLALEEVFVCPERIHGSTDVLWIAVNETQTFTAATSATIILVERPMLMVIQSVQNVTHSPRASSSVRGRIMVLRSKNFCTENHRRPVPLTTCTWLSATSTTRLLIAEDAEG